MFDHEKVVFRATTAAASVTGIEDLNNKELSTIADATVEAPGFDSTFTFTFDPAISGENVLFRGDVAGRRG